MSLASSSTMTVKVPDLPAPPRTTVVDPRVMVLLDTIQMELQMNFPKSVFQVYFTTFQKCISRKCILSRHDPTTPDATPLSPDARRDTMNVRLKLRAVPSVCSFIASQIWNLQRLVSPRQPRLYLVSPPV